MMVYDNLINHSDNNGDSNNYDDNGIINTSDRDDDGVKFCDN